MPGGISNDRCIDPHDRIDQLTTIVNEIVAETLEHTAGCGVDPTDLAAGTITIAYDPATMTCSGGLLGVITTNAGIDLEEEGTPVGNFTTMNFVGATATVTDAGGGQANITITSSSSGIEFREEGSAVVTATAVNFVGANVTVTDVAGVATVTITGSGGGGGGASLEEGAGIDISGDMVSVALAYAAEDVPMGMAFFDTADQVGSQGLAVYLDEEGRGGLEFADELDVRAGSVRDRNRFHLVYGAATSSEVPGNPSLDGIVCVHGEDPTAGNAATILLTSGLTVYCGNNDRLYAKYDNDGVRTAPKTEAWSTDTMENLRPILAGLPDYDPNEDMLLGHADGETDASQQKVQWKTVENWLRKVVGYDAAEIQVLMNTNGTVAWVTVSEC